MIDFLFNSWAGFLIYWVPTILCILKYTFKTVEDYRKDLVHMRKLKLGEIDYCLPADTLGNIISRILVSVIPVVNICDIVLGLRKNK